MALLDETGGKPLTGYGSGANTASPVATPQETAAMLTAQAEVLKDDANQMCRGDRATFDFKGDFCQAAIRESMTLRNSAAIIGADSNLDNLARVFRKAAVAAAKVGLGLTTPKGIVYVAGVAGLSAGAVGFSMITVRVAQACWAAAKLEGGLGGAELAANTCPFITTTLAQGAMLSAVFAALSGYALYQEGDRRYHEIQDGRRR